MLLLFTKNIAVQAAKKIKTAHDRVLSIQKTLDSSPIFSRKINCTNKKIQNEYFRSKDLMYASLRPFPLTEHYSKIEPNGFKYNITESATKHPILKDLFFQAQLQAKANAKMRFNFQVGETHGFSNTPNEFYVHEKYTFLSPIIPYFSDKRELYENAYELLFKNKEKFIEAGGEDFTNAFLSLFSVENRAKELENFEVSPEYLKQEIIFSGYKEDILQRGFKICSLCGASFEAEEAGEEIESILLYSNEKNELGIYLSLNEKTLSKKMPIISTENLNILIANQLYKKIIEDNLQVWLKDIIRMSDFASDIYSKISVKDLQERL